MTSTQTPVGTSPSASPARRRAPRKGATLRQQEGRAGLALLSPTLIIVLVVVVLPVVWTIVLAFQRIRLTTLQRQGFFGHYTLQNFVKVLSSPDMWSSLGTTLAYTIGGTVLSLGLGLVVALALRKPFRGRAFLRSAMLLPYVAPVVAATFVWEILLSPQFGAVNAWGKSIFGWDKPVAFLSQETSTLSLFGWHIHLPLALLVVIAFEGWRYFPFAFLFLLARLQAVPSELEEAARVDGATPTQQFRYVLLPQLAPVLALLSVLRFIMTFNKFDDVYLLTGGGAGTEMLPVRVYDFLTAQFDVGGAAAQALVLAVVLVLFLAVYLKFFAPSTEES